MTHEVRWMLPGSDNIQIREFPSQLDAEMYMNSMIDTAERDGFEFSTDPEIFEIVQEPRTRDLTGLAGDCS